jgi:hypothetical protein
MHYNFVRIHQTLKVTPAMAAGITSKLLGNGRHGESARGLGDLAMIEKQKKENDLIKLIDAALNWPISNAVRAELQSFNTPMIASMPSSSANGF